MALRMTPLRELTLIGRKRRLTAGCRVMGRVSNWDRSQAEKPSTLMLPTRRL